MSVKLPPPNEFVFRKLTKSWSCDVQIRDQTVLVSGIKSIDDECEDLLDILRLAERKLKSIARAAAKDVARHQYQTDHLTPSKLANQMLLFNVGYRHRLGTLTMYFSVPQQIFGGHDVEIDLGADESLGPAILTG